MTRAHLASLTLALIATLSSTGCGRHRYHVRYGHMPVRARAVYVPRAPAAPPPAPAEEAPAPAEVAPAPVYAAGPRPIVVYANAPGTTVVVINPAPAGPPVVQVAPGAPGASPMPAARMPQPETQPQESPEGWFEGE